MKSDDSLSRSHWIFKEIWFLFDIVMGGATSFIHVTHAQQLCAGEREESFKNSRLSRLSYSIFPHLFDLNRFDIASTIPWANSCITFLREWRHVIHNSFQPSRRLTSCSPSFLFYSFSFSLVPSCCFYPSCTLVYDPNTIESYKYVISPVSW